MDNRTATQFVVTVVNEGGCIDADLGGECDTLRGAIADAESIDRDAAEKCFNKGGSVGVQVQVWACDEYSNIGANFVDGAMLVFEKWL